MNWANCFGIRSGCIEAVRLPAAEVSGWSVSERNGEPMIPSEPDADPDKVLKQKLRDAPVYESMKAVLFCAALAAVISWLGPYYFITCEKSSGGVNCRLRQMLIGLIPGKGHEVSAIGSVNVEKHGAGRGATFHLELQGSEQFDFRADRAKLSAGLIEKLLEAPEGERIFFSDGMILWGLYLPVMVFLFGFFAVVNTIDQQETGPLASLPDLTEFFIGAYLAVGAAGFLFVYMTDVVRTPLRGWGLLVLAAMIGGGINVVRVRMRGDSRRDSSAEARH